MPPAQNVPPSTSLKKKAGHFWQRVSDGLEMRELWGQFVKDARSSYRLYSADLSDRQAGQSRRQRVWYMAKALFWAIIEKLSPARRVLLLLGLILLFFPAGGFTYNDSAGEVRIFEFDLHVFGGLLIFIVLLLELADRVVMKRDLEIAKDIQAWLLPGVPLAQLVTDLNRYACSNSQGGARFTTAFLAELDPATGELFYVNAGHNVPILRRRSGSVERPELGGIPVGVLADAVYQTGTTRLDSGDWLVIFTDGVVEAVNATGEEYDEPRLVRLIDRDSGSAPAELLRSLLADLDVFVGNTPQHDDMTCLLLKRG